MQEVGLEGDVTLDIEELTQYDGQGRCSEFDVWDDTRTRYEGRLEGWAADKGRSWRWLYVERKLERKEKRYSAIE